MSLAENKKLLHKKKHEIETNILLSDSKKPIDINNQNEKQKEKLKEKDKRHKQFVLDRLLRNLDTITKTINTH